MMQWSGGAMGERSGEFVQLAGQLLCEVAPRETRDLVRVGVENFLAGDFGRFCLACSTRLDEYR